MNSILLPQHENDPNKYTADALKISAIDSNKKIEAMSDDELSSLAKAIATIEGYYADPETQKEIWVESSTIVASNGTMPLPDTVLTVVSAGEAKTITADQHGRFPVLLHTKGSPPVEIKTHNHQGKETLLATLSGARSGVYVVHKKHLAMSAQTMPHKLPAGTSTHASPTPFKYVVHPGDTLDELAKIFKTNAAKIVKDNRLKAKQVFPSQEIWIHGPKPANTPPAHDWLSAFSGLFARSKKGIGSPLSLFDAKPQRAPWMTIALREAKRYAGLDEKEITKTHNYHRLVTDSDRVGGRTKEQRKHDHKPQWDGLPTLAGDNNPWCASFVNYCLKEAGYAPATAFASSFGFAQDKIKFKQIKEPVYGAIRFSKRQGGGHVCFVYGKVGNKMVVLGGNQGDSIIFEHPHSNHQVTYYIPISYIPREEDKNLPDITINHLLTEYRGAVQKNLQSSAKEN